MLKTVVEIRETTAQAIEAEKIRTAQAHARAMIHVAQVTTDTVAFCETVVAAAIEHAANRGNTYLNHWLDEELVWWGREDEYGIARLIVLDGKTKYADGTPSRRAGGREIIPSVMVDYLRAHGYNVSVGKEWYKWYNMGDQLGHYLEVSWDI